jgi:hypothetical protein
LPSSEEQRQRVGPLQGIPIFGLDALASAAYGPEAALTVLMALGAAGIWHILPLSGAIIVLLAIVYFSYRQTIAAYPQEADRIRSHGRTWARASGCSLRRR